MKCIRFWSLFFGLFPALLVLRSAPAYASITCPEPSSVKDFVLCQNKLVASRASRLSDYIGAYAYAARSACTMSGASAQPAAPDEGDLRCFFVFKSGATVSFNLLEGMNRNHIEVSEPTPTDDGADRGVLLAFFLMTKSISLADALASSETDLNDRGLKCTFCHQVLGNDQVKRDGIGAWVLSPIKLNSTVRGTIPRNGQIAPQELDRILSALETRHQCTQTTMKNAETCLRLRIIRSVKVRMPLDNP